MIIGILGKQRAGKDELAKFIALQYGDKYSVVIDKYARQLKCALMYGITNLYENMISYSDINGDNEFDREQELFTIKDTLNIIEASLNYLGLELNPRQVINAVIDYKKNEKNCPEMSVFDLKYSIRDLMKCLGTDVVRNLYSKKYWVDVIGNEYQELMNSDENTLLIVSDCRFDNECKVIKQNNGLLIEITSNRGGSDETHESENGIDLSDFEIVNVENNGTLTQLKHKAKEIGTRYGI